jgi:hypothetical protein
MYPQTERRARPHAGPPMTAGADMAVPKKSIVS